VKVAPTAVNADGQTVITKDPEPRAYRNDYLKMAIDILNLQGVAVMGAGFQPQTVTFNAGGS